MYSGRSWHCATRIDIRSSNPDVSNERSIIINEEDPSYMVHPGQVETIFEEQHPDFVKDLALNGRKINRELVMNKHPCEQKPGHYHELDQPSPCSKVHSHATIELRDQTEGIVRAQCMGTQADGVTIQIAESNYFERVNISISLECCNIQGRIVHRGFVNLPKL